MRRGDFAAAWEVSDAILAARTAPGLRTYREPRHLQTIWGGEPLAGKRVLVRCYHGLGDTIQFIRFAAPLRRFARRVVVWAQPALAALVATAPGVDEVLPLHDGVPEAEYDVDIEVMELAHAHRVDLTTLPLCVPYIFPSRLARTQRAPRAEMHVGLVWQAGGWDPRRSIPAAHLACLAHLSGARLFSLQRGPHAGEAARIPAQDVGSDDPRKAAEILRGLDLLITVDTFIAHLAGALGVATWLLLHTDADWRWMDERPDTPWYPTMRLFRQTCAGDWQRVIADVADAMRAAVSDRSGTRRMIGTNDYI